MMMMMMNYQESPSPLHITLTISVQIWTNYETLIFEKWGAMYPQTTVALPVKVKR